MLQQQQQGTNKYKLCPPPPIINKTKTNSHNDNSSHSHNGLFVQARLSNESPLSMVFNCYGQPIFWQWQRPISSVQWTRQNTQAGPSKFVRLTPFSRHWSNIFDLLDWLNRVLSLVNSWCGRNMLSSWPVANQVRRTRSLVLQLYTYKYCDTVTMIPLNHTAHQDSQQGFPDTWLTPQQVDLSN